MLPARLRWMSLPSAVILVLIATVLLAHAEVIAIDTNGSTRILIWIIAVFLALNTLGNLASKSRQEKPS
ncbi:hypothetical protein [Cohnella sp. JJ-181]|uniref:hypothetical protein n=1 Tax=Cohnella rhizoplanae TaxID=2974897 RepID=UPI0022FF62F2|nr:hypothetical protein [Cohnella sp. JJ-181]CAI6083190.1 hypothetical protein COHCIP112018_03903 [Cohnella sp. JJ-181]